MATVDLIKKFCTEEDLQKSVDQFNKMFKDRTEALKLTLKSISTLISDDKAENRPKYLAVLTELIRTNTKKLYGNELIEMFKSALPQTGNHINKRIRRLSLALCFLSIVKSGIIKGEINTLISMIQEIVEIAENNICFRTICYKIIIDILEQEVMNEDLYIDKFHPIIKTLNEESTEDTNRMYLWIKLVKLYPHISVPQDFINPMNKEFFVKYQQVLLQSKSLLPSIHPIWGFFAELDSTKLLEIVNELWINDKTCRSLVSMAVTSSIPYLEPNEFLSLLQNVQLFEAAISIKQNSIFLNVLRQRVGNLIESGGDISIQVIVSLLTIPRKHSFIIDIINNFCSRMNDEQTKALLTHLDEIPFSSICKLLWAQKHKENITDFSIVIDLFKAAATKAKTKEEKMELSDFLSLNLQRVNSDGKTWFSLISGNKIPPFDLSQSLESLIQSTNQVITALNSINTLLSIEPNFEPCEVDINSFVSFVSQLIKSEYPHYKAVGKNLLKKSMNLLTVEHMPLIYKEPELLDIAIHSSILCSSALPMYVQHIEQLPKTFWKSFNPDQRINLPITHDEAKSIVTNVISRCNGKSKYNYQEKIALAVISKLDEEEINEIVKLQIDKIVNAKNNEIGGELVISNLIKSSSNIAYQVLTYLTEITPKVERQSAINKIQRWVALCAECGEIPVQDISCAIYATLDREYQATTSGKKKAETALTWAQKLLNKIQRSIPRDIFRQLVEKYIKTGSRLAAEKIKQISNIE
ncbi:hypothetical protein GPJ56_003396 [Histomonas meleagridis]|uniref:uncharacterized protein n=1 Tax=Histomonas meleagridis TaxID=135588 RepID=UPI0035595148|nr:hypothetical protein GPJ56_003396 [Histomonas meleagridis]KAH0805015.1 hypothetical protein GO595_001960 [Histomonas meleagridis]